MLKLLQIQVPREQFDAVNELGWSEAMEKFPAVEAHMACTMKGSEGFVLEAHKEFYVHVANILTDDLETAFHIHNTGDEDRILRLGRQHSMSVGDILEDEAGNWHIVDGFGFKQVA